MTGKRTILDYPRNEAGLVDEFIGTAYDVVKEVYDNLDAIKNVGDQLDQIDEMAEAAVEEAMVPARVEIQAGVDAAEAAADVAVAAADRANSINTQYPFTYVEGQFLFDVTVITGDPNTKTAGMALWVEGALEYDFTIQSVTEFILNTPSAYAPGAQMRLIVNGHFDDTVRNMEELQVSFEEEFQAFLDASGLEVPIPYAPGILLTRNTQVLTHDGDDYRPAVQYLPFTTTNWASDSVKMVLVGNDDLRQDLLAPTGSSEITHTSTGSGALARPVSAKLRDITTGADYSSPQLAANASLNKIFFVPDGANIVIEVPAQAATLRAAVDAIDQWSIPTTSTVTINVAQGHHMVNQATVVTHPNSERITINGPEMSVNCTITGLVGTTGSRGNFIATLSVSNTTGLAIGDWLQLRDIAGSGGPYKIFNGTYQITAVGVGTVSVRIRLWMVAFPAMVLTGGNVYKYLAVIQGLWCDGLIIKSASPTVNWILFAGNMWDYWLESDIFGTEKGTHGVYIGSNTIVDGAGTPGGENPYGISGGSLSGKFVGAVDFDQQGFTTAGGAGMFGQYFSSSSCGRRGFYVGSGSAMEVKFSSSSTQYRDSVIADYGGAFNTSYFEGNGSRGAGAFANNGGDVIAPNSHFWANAVGMDIRAKCGGFFDASTARYNVGDGAHYEHGAGGSLSGVELSNNGVDGLSGFYSSAVRCTGLVSKDNGRDNINLLSSQIAYSGATLSNPGRRNITADGFTTAYDGTNYEPLGNHPAFYEVLMTDSTKARNGKFALNSIGDLLLTLDNVGRLVIKNDGVGHPSVDGGPTWGRSLNRFAAIYGREYIIGTGLVKDFSGSGVPEGNKSAVVGSTYRNETGGAGTILYYKASGTGNTGWVAIA